MEEEELLLREYEVCERYIEHYETLVWQTASIFLVLSLTGLAFFLPEASPSIGRFTALFSFCIVVAIALHLWYRVLRRWWAYQQVKWHRMREIEEQLGLWNNRYIHYLDAVSTGRQVSAEEADRDRLERLAKNVGGSHTVIRARDTVLHIIWLVIIAWVLVALRDLIFWLIL